MLPALLQIQSDITTKLAIELSSWGICVKEQRKMIAAHELEERSVCVTMTNGKSGAGCIVLMPSFINERHNVPGPLGNISLTVLVQEAPELNNNASTGTLRSAEEVAARVQQLLHLHAIQNIGTFYGDPNGITPTEADEGIIAYDCKFRISFGHDVLSKTANPAISGTHSAVTITASEGSAYYSIDGETYPGADVANSYLYAAPFAVSLNTVVRAVAYAENKTGSNLIETTIST